MATAASATAATWRQETPAHAGLSLRGTRTSDQPATQDQAAARAQAATQDEAAAPAQAATQDEAAAPAQAATQDLAAARIAVQASSKVATARAHRSSRHASPAIRVGRTPQQIARAMIRSFGWSSSQFACLKPLWAHESGWSVTAYNPGSGAYGIPQALPGSRMASAGPNWQTNAATQVRWGLQYIRGSYGSPCGAWNHELATGWY